MGFPLKKSAEIFLISLLLLFTFSSCSEGTIFYPYQASSKALSILNAENHKNLTIKKNQNGDYIMYPKDKNYVNGFIFYPGALVECEAYLPLAKKLSEKGFLVVVVHMPLDFAFFDINAADNFIGKSEKVQNWYIGGHSLGGAMAASYAASNAGKLSGLVLMAAYSTSEISDSLKVLSVYGSKDGVLNKDKYNSYKNNLPSGYTEKVIEGGCHAYFGDYGAQNGDGSPSITREDQLTQTVNTICLLAGL